jgi:hypothetical protein
MPCPLDLPLGEYSSPRVSPTPCVGRLREFPQALLFVSLLLCAICTSCGAVGSDPQPPPPVTVSVMPNSAQPFQGETVQFNAKVENASSMAVNWQVNGAAGGNTTVGMIDSTGLYTAPSLVPNPPTVTVTAVLQLDSTKKGSSSVTILALSSITGPLVVSPALSSLTTSQTLQLQVLTPGVSNSDVSWEADSGTITPGGMYTPPRTQGAYTVKASLIANPNSIGTAQVDVTTFPGMLTWRNDNARSGVNNQELALALGTVSSSTFGILFRCTIDGYAYAQPLYVPNLPIAGGVHNVVFVATEKDSVFAFDADADANPCEPLWKASLIRPGDQPILSPPIFCPPPISCPPAPPVTLDIAPSIGITGTPVIAMSASTLYAVATTQDLATAKIYSHRLHALDLATGQELIQGDGIEIASPPGQTHAFSSSAENQRPALLLDNGILYVAFGSYQVPVDYRGWVFAYDASSLQQTGVFDIAPKATSGGGIWQSGGGPSADSNHNVFVATGDGPPNISTNYIDSILRLGTSGGLSVADFYTPCDQGLNWGASPSSVLQSESSAPVLLPDSAGSATQPHLLIGGSKEGFLYIVNRDNMGGFPSPCSDSAPRVQAVQTGGAILSTPLFWNNFVYVAPGNGSLMSFPLSAGILNPSQSQSTQLLGPQGATPVISSNGTNNAILWLIDSSGALATPSTPAILRAYDPNNLSNEIYNSAMATGSRDMAGPAVKFTVPTVANGKVYVGTQTELDVYGLLQ